MSLLKRSEQLKLGYNPIMGPENYPLKYLRFGRLLLEGSPVQYEETGGLDEIVISIFSGRCDIAVCGKKMWEGAGGRDSVFAGPPVMAYIPRNSPWSVRATTPRFEAGIFRAPARRDTAPALVTPSDYEIKTPGAASWERRVATVVGENVDADRLIVGETYSLPGKWSSYPPHKHDCRTPPREAWYEEVYHYLVHPKQGFGVQLLYTAPGDPEPLDEAHIVHDGDSVAIPKGYHPFVAGGGYEAAYYWALAGEERVYAAWSDDPAHAWLRDVELTLKNT